MVINFDSRGNLVPNSNIKCTLEMFYEVFVKGIPSSTRPILYDSLITYAKELKQKLGDHELVLWINGSYTTKKKDPNDLDLVTFVDYAVIEQKDQLLQDFKFPDSLSKFGVDAYIVKVYPREHKNYPLYIGDHMYWMDRFDKNKRNRNGVKIPKGFIEVTL